MHTNKNLSIDHTQPLDLRQGLPNGRYKFCRSPYILQLKIRTCVIHLFYKSKVLF